MSPLLLLAVVDQVDPPGALVELQDGELVAVEVRCLPPRSGEGDRLLYLDRPLARCPRLFFKPFNPAYRTTNRSQT